MREGAEDLRPDDAKVPDTPETLEISETAVEDVGDEMQAETGYDCLSSFIAMVRGGFG